MSTLKHSGFEALDWMPPWRVERPERAKPLPGPEREVWLEHRLLYRSSRTLKHVLDRIDPAIARNEPVTALDEEAVTVALLEFLQGPPPDDASRSLAHSRMPLHKARVFLDYFTRGFTRYCLAHELRQPRLPLIREFSLDEGSLSAGIFDMLRTYRRCVRALIDKIDHLFNNEGSTAVSLSPEDAAALIVCSSALFGGLVRKTHWEALAAALGQPLRSSGSVVWFWFDRPRPYRWIADPVTEAILRRLWEQQPLPVPQGTKLSAKSIRWLLGLDAGHSSPLTSLEDIARVALVRHFAPDVAAIAQGVIPNTPLAEEPWLRLISGTRHRAPRATIALTLPRIMPAAHADTLQQVAIQEIIDGVTAAVHWDPTARRKGGSTATGDHGARKYASQATLALRTCEGNLEQLFARAGQPDGHRRTFAYGLICYARDLIELGGLKVRELAPSTISNYIGIVRNHLARLRFADLVELGTEARAEAYREDIHRQIVKDRSIHRTAFEGFERSILRHMDIADEVDWATIPGRARQRHLPAADANVLDPALYRHVFEALETPARDAPIAALARALLVILYRFGLRTGEAAEVTAGALTIHAGGRASLRVTRSELTSRKSANAIRLVGPVDIPADELAYLTEYCESRAAGAARRGRDRAHTYLFGTGGTDKLEHVEPAQRLVIDALREAAGDPNLRPRHFRHSFVSRFYLSGRDVLGCFEQAGAGTTVSEWSRAYATGHASPDTGIVSYTHVNEIAHYHYACQLVSDEAPLSFLSRLAGNDARSLERTRLRTPAQIGITDIFLQALRRNVPGANIENALTHRTAYPQLRFQPIGTEIQGVGVERLSWACAWEVYANARVGRTSDDMTEQAGLIRARVRQLEMCGRLVRRMKRRPQLAPDEQAAAALVWQALPDEPELQGLVNAAADWLRPRGRKILMPAEIAHPLIQRFRQAGLTRLEMRAGTSQRSWIRCPTAAGDNGTGWLEFLAFLACGTLRRTTDQ